MRLPVGAKQAHVHPIELFIVTARARSMSTNIRGKVVVITGASSGLGEAAARLLSAEGATVVLGARRVDRIDSLAKELIARGGKALAIPTDVTHHEQVKKLVDAAVETYGRIDVRVSAGKRVLLADLRQENAVAAAEVLRHAGFEVTPAIVDVSSRDNVESEVRR
jgi:NADPH:quinone reductase-like Zn-dependent oxidoreductase